MRAAKSIFIKQLNDLPKNVSILLLYIMYPGMALMMTTFLDDNSFVVTFAMMFVGGTPLVTVANSIAEDVEYKSLRFLMIAGVKPHQYMLGLGGFTLILAIPTLAVFGLIGGYGPEAFAVFMLLSLLGCIPSAILGAVVGIFSKNVQQSSAIYTPLMIIIGFLPFISLFNETVQRLAYPLFTQQIFMRIADITFFGSGVDYEATYVTQDFINSVLIILGNIVVFGLLFIIAYKKKGLKG